MPDNVFHKHCSSLVNISCKTVMAVNSTVSFLCERSKTENKLNNSKLIGLNKHISEINSHIMYSTRCIGQSSGPLKTICELMGLGYPITHNA